MALRLRKGRMEIEKYWRKTGRIRIWRRRRRRNVGEDDVVVLFRTNGKEWWRRITAQHNRTHIHHHTAYITEHDLSLLLLLLLLSESGTRKKAGYYSWLVRERERYVHYQKLVWTLSGNHNCAIGGCVNTRTLLYSYLLGFWGTWRSWRGAWMWRSAAPRSRRQAGWGNRSDCSCSSSSPEACSISW